MKGCQIHLFTLHVSVVVVDVVTCNFVLNIEMQALEKI